MKYSRNETLIATGEKIREERKKRKLNQKQFSEMLVKNFTIKADRSKIAKWETGRLHIQDDELIALAKCFNVTIDYLLGLSEAKTTDPEVKEICEYTGLREEIVNALHHWKNDKQERVNHLNKLFSLQETKYLLLKLFEYCDKCEEYADKVYKKTEEADYKDLHFYCDDNSSVDDNFKAYHFGLDTDYNESKDNKELRYLIFENSQKFIGIMESFQDEYLQESKELFAKKLKDFIKELKEGANND